MQIQEMKGKAEVSAELSVENQKIEDKVLEEKKVVEIGEARNRNIRTKISSSTDITYKIKAEDRKFEAFKREAKIEFERQEKIKKNLSGELLKQLDIEGIQVETSDSKVVEKNVENILKNRKIKKKQLEKQVERLAETKEEVQRMALSDVKDREIIEKLEKSGVPPTKENIEKFNNAVKIAKEAVEGLEEPAMKSLIENERSETVENIYKAEHSREVVPKMVGEVKDTLWQEVKAEANELLWNQGVEKAAESEEAAEWLFKNKLEISSDNVAKYLSLKNLKEGAEKPEEWKKNEDKITKKMAEGGEPLKTELGSANEYRARYSLYYFKTVIETKAVFHEVVARRNIEEIRLKLTEESAMKMLSKGIRIDVTDLKGLVEKLREQEADYFLGLSENKEQVREAETEKKGGMTSLEIFRTTLSIRAYNMERGEESDYRYGSLFTVYHSEERVSLSEFHKAGLAYEQGRTEVRSDLGDSLKKAFSGIDEILKLHDLELTEANRRAVKLLIYNHAEVEADSVLKMKKALLLTEEVFREMKPKTVAELINKGENPLDLPIDKLLEKLKGMNRELKPEEERFSSYLYRLEKSGEMKGEERKAYIGIYRLLTRIEKGDYAAVGSVSLSEKSLTLRNFLEGARTRRLGHFEEEIREGMGEIVRVSSDNRIDKQIETAYRSLLAGKIKSEMEAESEGYLEEKAREMKEKEIILSDVESLIEEGEKINLSTTIAQMEVRTGRKGLKKFLMSLKESEREENGLQVKGILEGFEEPQKTADRVKKFTEKMMEKVEKESRESSILYSEHRELLGMRKVLGLSLARAERESFDIPLLYDGDKYADMQIRIRRGSEKEKGKFSLNLLLEEGEIRGDFRLSQGRVSGFFAIERREEYDKLKALERAFREKVKELGFEGGEISYHLGKTSSQIRGMDDIYSSENKTKEIYRLAKITVTHVLMATEIW